MFRKILLLCIAIPVVWLISGAVFSACRQVRVDDEAYVCGISFSADGAKNQDTVLLSSPPTFHISTSAKGSCMAPNISNPFIANSYAATRCFNWKNNLIQSSFHLSFDRSILMEGDTIAAGSNVLENYTFSQYAGFKAGPSQCNNQDHDLVIGDTLLQKMSFQPGTYRAYFNCLTTDGRPYEAHLYVIFKQ